MRDRGIGVFSLQQQHRQLGQAVVEEARRLDFLIIFEWAAALKNGWEWEIKIKKGWKIVEIVRLEGRNFLNLWGLCLWKMENMVKIYLNM